MTTIYLTESGAERSEVEVISIFGTNLNGLFSEETTDESQEG